MLFLLGTQMDYKADKLSAQFVFNNPNQTSACGCGKSVAAQARAARICASGLISWRPSDLSRAVLPSSVQSRVRRMFGGAGIYADDTMFGLDCGRRHLSQDRRKA